MLTVTYVFVLYRVILMQLADLILPKTDTPSATEAGVHIFLDRYLNEVSGLQEQTLIQTGLGTFIKKALNNSGKKRQPI